MIDSDKVSPITPIFQKSNETHQRADNEKELRIDPDLWPRSLHGNKHGSDRRLESERVRELEG